MDWLRKRVAADVRKPERDPASAKKAPLLSPSDGTEAGEDITAEPTERKHPKKKHTEVLSACSHNRMSRLIQLSSQHKYSTSNFKISHRKLNMLGRQIAGKPIDHAVLQMMFSEKRASKRLKSMLVLAKEHAIRYKELDLSRLIVCKLPMMSRGVPFLRHDFFSHQRRHGSQRAQAFDITVDLSLVVEVILAFAFIPRRGYMLS